MAKALVIQGVEDDPPSAVCRIASSPDRPFSEISCMSSEVSLGDPPFRSATEGNAHMLQFINNPGCIPDHNLDGILITEVITSLDRIEEVPFPTVFFLIAERGSDSTLGRARMGTCWKNLADHSHISLAHTLHCSTKSCQPRSDDDDVMGEVHVEPK
jgi:hypothetical protein